MMVLCRFLRCVLAAIPLLSLGCGPSGPEIASVEGTVTLDDKPLEGALVMFYPKAGGRPAAGRTDASGHYELQYSQGRSGALPGEHDVTISTVRDGDPDAGVDSAPERLPAKYNVKSELTATVETDDNVIDFKLDSQGKIIEQRR